MRQSSVQKITAGTLHNRQTLTLAELDHAIAVTTRHTNSLCLPAVFQHDLREDRRVWRPFNIMTTTLYLFSRCWIPWKHKHFHLWITAVKMIKSFFSRSQTKFYKAAIAWRASPAFVFQHPVILTKLMWVNLPSVLLGVHIPGRLIHPPSQNTLSHQCNMWL